LKVYGIKENTLKYALKLIDALFIDKQDLQYADPKKIDEDSRIKAIYGIPCRRRTVGTGRMRGIPVHS
jgi:hypothetical protein